MDRMIAFVVFFSLFWGGTVAAQYVERREYSLGSFLEPGSYRFRGELESRNLPLGFGWIAYARVQGQVQEKILQARTRLTEAQARAREAAERAKGECLQSAIAAAIEHRGKEHGGSDTPRESAITADPDCYTLVKEALGGSVMRTAPPKPPSPLKPPDEPSATSWLARSDSSLESGY